MSGPHRARRAAVLAALFLAAGAVVSAPPNEQEDPKGGVKKKIVVDTDVDYRPRAGTQTAPDARLDELALAANQTTNPALKELYARFAVPHDQLTEKGGATRIRPFPLHWGKDNFPRDKAFNVTELNAAGKATDTRPAVVAEVTKLDSYEQLVAAAVDGMLKTTPKDASSDDTYTAADRLLAAGLRFHDYAKNKGIRPGKNWDPVRPPLVDLQKTVWLRQLKAAVSASDLQKIGAASSKLLSNFAADPVVAREVTTARLSAINQLLEKKVVQEMIKARELLDELEAKLAGGGGAEAKALRQKLSAEALRYFNIARDRKSANDLAGARDALRLAEALDPTLSGLRELARELKTGYAILGVGVRQFPERMSPATARFDSERQAVALMFEGLLEEVPDDTGGVRYRAAAARYLPLTSPGGRELQLRAVEGGARSGAGVDPSDVVETVKLMRTRPELWPCAGLPWFPDNDLPSPTTAGAVRLPFKMTHPDPRALLTFKVLPGRWMGESNKAIDDPEFASRPQGSGPYKLQSVPPPSTKGPREAVFVDNAAYGKWPDRTGLPYIREVRLIEVSKLPDLVSEFKYDRLHILPDVPTGDLDRFTAPSAGLGGKIVVATAQNSRRVHILAVNHRRPHLQNKELRRGLAAAIDRETVLSDVFRAGKFEFHREMTGPFPPTSWATKKGPNGKGERLTNVFFATEKLKRYLASPGAKPEITLAYPDDDPLAAKACERIKAQVEILFKDVKDPKGRVTLILEPVPSRELARRVEEEHRFDLAYVPFDYPDDWHPFGLAAFLDAAAVGRDGRNWLGYLDPGTNPDAEDLRLKQMLAELRGYRDYKGSLLPKVIGTAGIHDLFNDCMPFVPLWQLDRHTIVHTGLKIFVDDATEPSNPRVLNPSVLFHNVARWRLD